VAAALIFTGLPACDSEPADDDDEVLQTTLLEVDLSDGEAWLSLREARVLEPNEVDDTNWDLHIDGWNLFLNGGASGNGSGAGIPFRDLDPDLQFDQVNREQDILYFLFQDDYGSVLSNWWAYGLRGGHTVYSRFHRYWLHDQGRWWKLQVLSYYQLVSGAPEAAQISFRWQESNPSGPGELRELVVDASAGGVSAAPDDPLNEFRYVDLERGEVTRLSDDAAATSMDWHIGFRRFYIRLNGGTSGPRGIASYDHDAAGEETPEALLAMSPENSLEGFEQLNWADRPDESLLSQDQVTPVLTGWYSGNPGAGASALPTPFLAATATDSHRAKLRVIDLEDGNQQSPLSLSLEYALLP
tara:strand:- start:414 stop:1484 length:1071 start_codon:yes stop_codon:yes gene_type:complete